MAFRQVNSSDQNLQLIQGNVADAIRILDNSALIGGNILQGLALISGNTTISHKLGRTPVAWLIVDSTAAASIYRVSWDDKHIVLHSSAALSASLWVR